MLTRLLPFLLLPSLGQADWREDAGYNKLSAELGAALPTGAGITVLQAEASMSSSTAVYLPEGTADTIPYAGSGNFAGKTFAPLSGASVTSGHAAAVGDLFYGTGSISQGVTNVRCWLADHWAGTVLDTNPDFLADVQNHSWVGSSGSDTTDQDLLRNFDLMLGRDSVVSTAPLNNGAGQAKLLGNSFHAISVGLRNGNHPQTHSNLDVINRMKPDLVVDELYTSYAGPAVGSAAALLLDAIRPAFSTADDPRVVKALLLTAASKDRLPGWKRLSTTRPYDEVHGAGELHIYDAYHTLQAGRHTPSNSVEAGPRGWDRGSAQSSSPRRYFFTVPAGQWAERFSATVTWHRRFTGGTANASLPDLNLVLRAAASFTPGAIIDQSNSSIDNVEHLFLRHLPPGQYALEVSSDTASVTYGLAWETHLSPTGPTLSLTRSGSTSQLHLSKLDPLMLYTLQSSADLVNWSTLTTLRTADSTPSFTASHTQTLAEDRHFYRLTWTSWR